MTETILDKAKSSKDFVCELREQAKASLYFLTKAILGFNKLTPTLHKDFYRIVCNLFIQGKKMDLLIFMIYR